jgi:hypothetical protein
MRECAVRAVALQLQMLSAGTADACFVGANKHGFRKTLRPACDEAIDAQV